MVLITGGAWQGKTDFAKKFLLEKEDRIVRIVDGSQAAEEDWRQVDMFTDFHLWVARLLREDRDVYEAVNRMLEENPTITVTVNELGCGIVPVDAFDRKWRETTGRVCCLLAQKSTGVYRVTCGVATKIK